MTDKKCGNMHHGAEKNGRTKKIGITKCDQFCVLKGAHFL